MAEKGWTARVATAAGVAAGTGAAQLGLGYGLGVIVWPVTVTEDRSEWLGSLGWATWITASATVFGAVIASRLGAAPARRLTWPWRVAFAAFAGVGALVAVALIALPARSAVRLDAHSPQLIAAGYALLGVLLGVIVAYWAIWSRPVAANLIATSAWLWALAITAIIVELAAGRDSATYLSSWQFAEPTIAARYGVISWPSALLTLSAAFLIGVIAVLGAVRRGDLGVGAATSGAVGPLLVAVSFLALSPRLTGTPAAIESAYLIAPYAVLAGLAGSALAVAAGKSMAIRPETPAADDQTTEDTDTPDTAAPANAVRAGTADSGAAHSGAAHADSARAGTAQHGATHVSAASDAAAQAD
ncbi:MAG TPA: Hansenula MRAKII killer toxin-resistant protein 1, partial [Actinoplanes sp.]|nr:Hansenula MRAKII killer toxin-resistant protein 1 [Actinoplanes sp.]